MIKPAAHTETRETPKKDTLKVNKEVEAATTHAKFSKGASPAYIEAGHRSARGEAQHEKAVNPIGKKSQRPRSERTSTPANADSEPDQSRKIEKSGCKLATAAEQTRTSTAFAKTTDADLGTRKTRTSADSEPK